MREISLAFLCYVSGSGLHPVIAVGIVGKQQWHRDVLPNLKRALRALTGKPAGKDRHGDDTLYIWPMPGGSVEENISIFKKWNLKGEHIRIVLNKDKTFRIYAQGQKGT